MSASRLVLFNAIAVLLISCGVSAAQVQPKAARPKPSSDPIDLSAFYGKVAGTEGDSWFTHPDWKTVPKGLQEFDGILFDVSGTLLFRSTNLPQLKEKTTGIPIKKKCRYIHLLQGIGYADEDGTTVVVMEIHYANGEKRDVPIVYGVHVRNWWKMESEKVGEVSDPNSGIAWSGPGDGTSPPPPITLRLYRSSFLNPLADQPIDHVDFISKNSKATLCIVSMSIGDSPPVRKTNTAP